MTVNIADLEAALRVEEEALEAAFIADNKISIALYKGSVKRAYDALTAARVADGTGRDCGVCP